MPPSGLLKLNANYAMMKYIEKIILLSDITIWFNDMACDTPGVGVTKPISSVPLFSHFFTFMSNLVIYGVSRSYLANVSAA